ncbi:MAG: RluA family pseudouridine synthase [Ruminococcaceae bacterium]|nr:RluA family pseudouridine synthase [Oscillospiraceae bacterium]
MYWWIEMEILYSDQEIAVIYKPAGMLSEAKENDENTVPAALSAKLNKKEVFPVHRLDRETRGIMVYALTRPAAAELSRQIADGELKKVYTATVHGRPKADSGEMHDLLFYDRKKNRSFPVTRERRGVKSARLCYEMLQYDKESNTSRVKIELYTGRTHQIRVQFASRKMPLVGDRKYGAPKGDFDLTACKLSFYHPKTKEFLSFG